MKIDYASMTKQDIPYVLSYVSLCTERVQKAIRKTKTRKNLEKACPDDAFLLEAVETLSAEADQFHKALIRIRNARN